MYNTSGGGLIFNNIDGDNNLGNLTINTTNGTFNSITLNGNGSIYGNNTIGKLTLAPGKQYGLQAGKTQTILNDLVANGSCAAPIVIQSSSSSPATISKSSDTLSVRFCSLSWIHAVGGAEFIAENSIDLGNNSGWVFTSVPQNLYWVGGLGLWDDVAHWSAESGGEGGYCVPTKIDNVFFDANSFTQTAQAIFVNVANAECRNMDWTDALNEPTITSSSPNNNLKIYGSLLLNPAMNFTFSGSVYFEGESPAKDTWEIDMAGESFSNAVYFDGMGSVWTLLDALSITGNDLYLNYGTLNTNGESVNIRQFISNNNNTRTLNMGASVFKVSSPLSKAWYAEGNNFIIDPGTSEIRLTGANGGFWSIGSSPLSYNKVHFQNAGGSATLNSNHTFDEIIFNPAGKIMGAGNFGEVQFNASGEIAGSNSFEALLFSPGTVNVLQAGATQTIAGAFNFWGNAAMPIAIHSSIPGAQATISKASEVVSGNYILLQDMNATGGATFDVYNSEDLGNNTGWNFLEPPEATCPLDMEVCENLPPFVLNTAAPAGGVYSGEGVYYDEENEHYMFDPSTVVGEQSVITYAIGGLFPDSCEYVIVILPLPVVECPDDMEVCAGSDYINLYEGEGLFYLNEIMITGFDPLNAGTYEITYTETNECGSTSCDFIIEVLAMPEIVITGALEFCKGGSSILSAAGGVSYLWNTGATNPEIEVAVSGNYSVTGTDENGCESTVEVLVTVFPLPTAQITGELNLCEGESTILTAIGGVSYLWSTGETNASITVSEAGEYSVTVIDEHGCENMASVMLTVNPLPDVEITGEFEFCEGDAPFTLTGGLPVGGVYYVNGLVTTVFDPALPGNYALLYEYSDAFSCIGSATVEIIVHPLPLVTLEEFPDLCEGAEPITLLGGQPEGGNYFVNGTGASTFNPATAGVYEVMYEYANDFACFNSAMGEIIVHPLPEVEITGNFSFCISASTELTASEGVSYLWSTDETTQSIIVTQTGVYSVVVTDINGCEGYAEATVTEEDNQPPTITAAPDIVVAADNDLCYASDVNLGEPQTDDNCGIASIANDAPEVFPVGITEITWT
ncbi:MAG: hypothetical protein EOM90_17060, partial [Alphaproteobacteria bacterium]|nr:hypothetical protein [Alphaproteobacteria bacterium]